MTKHTFVIPAYKEAPFLEFCIINLKNQTVASSIIITTSTPTAQTRTIAENYNIPYFVNKENNLGIGNDWNFALSKVSTKLATIAHQDDIYKETYTENILKYSNKYNDSLILFTDYEDIVKNDIRSKTLNSYIKKILLLPFLFKANYASKIIKKSVLMLGDPICCPSVTFNLENINHPKKLFSINIKCVLDWDAWLKLSNERGSFIFINKKLVLHRIHESSETSVSLISGIRKKEEYEVYKSIWGKYLAQLLMFFYSMGHKNNEI